MFLIENIETGNVFNVYATKYNDFTHSTLFLVYYDNQWHWLNAEHFKPYGNYE